MNQIKINRAHRLADVGRYGQTAAAMAKHLPPSLIERLTGAELADVMDALRACSLEGQAIAQREALENGFVWDRRTDAPRYLVGA